jgi:hypothetical protein
MLVQPMDQKPPVPHLPGGPDPTQPIPRDPVEGVDLRGCAGIAAALAARVSPRPAILARHRLDEVRWANVEKTWMLRIAGAMLAGDLALAQEYDALLAEAQEALGAEEADLGIEAYASLLARLEAGHEPAQTLSEAGLTAQSFARIQRRWAKRVAGDAAQAEALRGLVARESARLG